MAADKDKLKAAKKRYEKLKKEKKAQAVKAGETTEGTSDADSRSETPLGEEAVDREDAAENGGEAAEEAESSGKGAKESSQAEPEETEQNVQNVQNAKETAPEIIVNESSGDKRESLDSKEGDASAKIDTPVATAAKESAKESTGLKESVDTKESVDAKESTDSKESADTKNASHVDEAVTVEHKDEPKEAVHTPSPKGIESKEVAVETGSEKISQSLADKDEIIGDLKEENDRLNAKISKLELKIRTLENEVARLNSPEVELSLSPVRDRGRTGKSARTSSFVEADLYAESSNIPSLKQTMDQWKDWQLDMRGWATIGFGPVVSL